MNHNPRTGVHLFTPLASGGAWAVTKTAVVFAIAVLALAQLSLPAWAQITLIVIASANGVLLLLEVGGNLFLLRSRLSLRRARLRAAQATKLRAETQALAKHLANRGWLDER